MEQTYNELIRTVTEDYLGGVDMDSIPSPETIENELLQATNNAIERYNLGPRDENAPIGAKLKDAYPDQKPPGERLKKLRELLPLQIALAIKQVHHAKLICWAADEGGRKLRRGRVPVGGGRQGRLRHQKRQPHAAYPPL